MMDTKSAARPFLGWKPRLLFGFQDGLKALCIFPSTAWVACSGVSPCLHRGIGNSGIQRSGTFKARLKNIHAAPGFAALPSREHHLFLIRFFGGSEVGVGQRELVVGNVWQHHTRIYKFRIPRSTLNGTSA